MNKVQGLKVFLEQVVLKEMDLFLDHLLKYVNENKQNIIESVVCSFKAACRAEEKLPESKRGGVEYVQFTLSRSDAMLRQDFYKIELFDRNLYMDGYLCESPLAADWLYREFFDFCDCISEKSKQYIGQIGKPELDRIQLCALETCQKLLKYILKEALKSIVETEEYISLPDASAFHLSSYRGQFQVIYVKNMQSDQWRKYINGLLQNMSGQKNPKSDTACIAKT